MLNNKTMMYNNILTFLKKHWQISLITAIFFLIQLSIILFVKRSIGWDESVYLGIGKYIYSYGASGLWEYFRPLIMSIIYGIPWKIGLNIMVSSQFISLLFSTGCIILVYIIANKLFEDRLEENVVRNIAFLSALLVAISPIFFQYSTYILTDIPSLFFLLSAWILFLYKKNMYSGIFFGIACLTKFSNMIFFIPIVLLWCYYLCKKLNASKDNNIKNDIDIRNKTIYKSLSIFLIASIIIMIPYFLFNLIYYSSQTSPISNNMIGTMISPVIEASRFQNNPYQNMPQENIYQIMYSIFYYMINIIFSNAYGAIIFLFFIYAIYLFFSNDGLYKHRVNKTKQWHNDINTHAISAMLFLTLLIYYSSIPYKQDRFMIFFLPIVAIYTSYAVYDVIRMSGLKKYHKTIYKILFAILIITLLMSTLYKDSQMSYPKD